jgi:hypothetical protein
VPGGTIAINGGLSALGLNSIDVVLGQESLLSVVEEALLSRRGDGGVDRCRH